jgi:hypothetical protein
MEIHLFYFNFFGLHFQHLTWAFFHTPRGKNGKFFKEIIFGLFWCGVMNICNKKLVLDV